MITRQAIRTVALLAIGVLATGSSQAQTTLYSDDFSGTGSLLDGVAVDVSNSLSTQWIANSAFLDDGTTDGSLSGSALLDVLLQPNAQYNLSVDVAANAVGGDWGGFGFASGDAVTFIGAPGADGGNDDRFTDGPGGRSWTLLRDIDGALNAGDIEFFSGAGAGGGINADDTFDIVAGTVYDAEIELITAADGASYTVELFLNGASVLEGDGGLGTPATINDSIALIGSVGLTFNNTLTPGHTYDNFILTEQVLGAADNVWNVDGGGSFNVAGNWSENAAPTSTATFGAILTAANSPAAVTLDSPVALSNVVFSNAAADYVLAGPNSLSLIGDATVATNAGRHWISTGVDGSLGLNKTGAGELILDHANSFSGDITVAAGRLSVTEPNAIPSGANVQLTDAGANLLFGGDNGFFVDNGSTGGGYVGGSVNGVISGDGSVTATLGATVTLTAANTFNGALTVEGDDTVLTLSGSGTPGASDGTTATETRIGGAAQVVLQSKAIGDEVLKLNERADAGTPAHLSSSGASSWAGNIHADATGDGGHYKIEATSGTLTLSGTLSAFDEVAPNDRFYVFDAAGSSTIRVTGRISDYGADADGNLVDADMSGEPDGSAGDNIHVIKRGAGTLTIETGTTNDYDYHKASTTIEEGTLRVVGNGAGDGELLSSTISVKSGATFDITNFGTGGSAYSQQFEQTIGGAGVINTNGAELALFGDSNLAPGDGDTVGTLTINGDTSLNRSFGGGALQYGLGDTSAEGDQVLINGSFTTTGSQAMTIEVTPVEGTLQGSGAAYTLLSHNVGSAANVSGLTVQAVNNLGEALNPRQTFQVSSTSSQVRLQVNGVQSNLTWAGSGGNNTWDVATSANWSGGNQFRDLDTVTFGAAGEKNVVVNASVTPGSTTFNGGAGSTYSLTGSGGIAGYGAVDVNSGTVQLLNIGNDFRGTTNVSSGARLEMSAGTAGRMVVNGTLAAINNTVVTPIDDFEDASLAEYTFAKVLDQGTVTNTSFESPAGVLANTSAGADGAEQTLLFRSDFQLAVGQELRADAVFDVLSGNDLGIAVGETPTDLGDGGSGETRNSADFLFISIRQAGQINSRGFNSGAEIGQVQEFGLNVDQLFIARTANDTVELGWYDGTTRNVLRTETVAESLFDNVGFYGDLRADGAGYSGFDNLRFQEGSEDLSVVIDGDLVVASTGGLEFELSNTGFADIAVTGVATLDGAIDVALDNLSPTGGDQFTILTAAGGITDLGVNFNLPQNFTAAIVGGTDLVLSFAAGLAGDFNGDGVVDAADYTVWRDNSGSPEEYAVWRDNYGATSAAINSAASSQAAVPEPSSALLLALVLGGGALAMRQEVN